jgi:hypothetical protein
MTVTTLETVRLRALAYLLSGESAEALRDRLMKATPDALQWLDAYIEQQRAIGREGERERQRSELERQRLLLVAKEKALVELSPSLRVGAQERIKPIEAELERRLAETAAELASVRSELAAVDANLAELAKAAA